VATYCESITYDGSGELRLSDSRLLAELSNSAFTIVSPLFEASYGEQPADSTTGVGRSGFAAGLLGQPLRKRLPDVRSEQDCPRLIAAITQPVRRGCFALICACGLRLRETVELPVSAVESNLGTLSLAGRVFKAGGTGIDAAEEVKGSCGTGSQFHR